MAVHTLGQCRTNVTSMIPFLSCVQFYNSLHTVHSPSNCYITEKNELGNAARKPA